MNIPFVKDRLLQLGISAEKVDGVMNDVHGIIAGELVLASVRKAPQAIQDEFSQLSPEQQRVYIQDHAMDLPQLSVEEVNHVVESTWEEYFTYMKKGE